MSLFIVLLIFIAVAATLAWFLIAHDHGEREPVLALWMAAGFGLAGALLAGLLEFHFIPPANLEPGVAQRTLLPAALGVGLIEECCKFLPLALVLYSKRYFNEQTDGVIYFALAGLGFGLPENILYTLQFGSGAGIGRLILTPFFHAATCGLIGYYLVRRKLARKSPLGVLPVLLLAVALHGLYDFGLLSGSGLYALGAVLITFGVSAGLFVIFSRATEHDQEHGLSVVGHNSFCRSCGAPNPEHHLYCVNCGKNA